MRWMQLEVWLRRSFGSGFGFRVQGFTAMSRGSEGTGGSSPIGLSDRWTVRDYRRLPTAF